MNNNKNEDNISRRRFIAAGAAVTAAISGFPFVKTSRAQNVKPLKIGLIGCGGRGTGAVANALEAAPDIHLIALADPFPDRVERTLGILKDPKRRGGPLTGVEVKEDHLFTGMDCDKKLLETDIDIALLVSPPGFRPRQFELAVEAGKHIFMEKPLATDPVGVRKIIKTAKKAKEKGLSIVAGLNRRHSVKTMELVKRIHDGQIGDVVSARAFRLHGYIRHKGDNPSWTDMEYQCRNWYYHCWLSGDQIVEMVIHNVDFVNWVIGAHPVKAIGVGGRQVRKDPKYGNIYDHMAVDYEYPNDVHMLCMCRQIDNCGHYMAADIFGSKGKSDGKDITGLNPWKSEKDEVSSQVYEHKELIDSIRNGNPRNDALDFAAESTLTTIMGREAAYTGKVVTWDEMVNSDLDLYPKNIEFGSAPKRPIAMPGQPRPR